MKNRPFGCLGKPETILENDAAEWRNIEKSMFAGWGKTLKRNDEIDAIEAYAAILDLNAVDFGIWLILENKLVGGQRPVDVLAQEPKRVIAAAKATAATRK